MDKISLAIDQCNQQTCSLSFYKVSVQQKPWKFHLKNIDQNSAISIKIKKIRLC